MSKSHHLKELDDAATHQRLVRVTRKKGWDRLDGSIQLAGSKWLGMAIQVDAGFNGYSLIRRSDIRRIDVDPDAEFVEAALSYEGDWPLPMLENIDLTTTKSVLLTASTLFPLISIYYEQEHPDECLVGTPRAFQSRIFKFKNISTGAKWLDSDSSLHYSEISRIDLGGAYERRLARVAGAVTPSGPLGLKDSRA